MNAGAYGRDWSDVLVRALVVTADGEEWLAPDELGLAYRHSALGAGQVVARVEYRLERRPPAEIRAAVAELIAQRKATQPTNKRTFGSVFKNPARRASARAGCSSSAGSRAIESAARVISPKHANFIENADGATSADCVALMVEARRRAHEEFGVELEREVVFVGSARASGADVGGVGARGESSRMAGGRSARGSRRHAAAASVVVPFPRDAAGARLDLARFVPSGRSLLATFGVARGRRRRVLGRVRDPGLRGRAGRRARRTARALARGDAGDARLVGQSLVAIDARRGRGHPARASRRRRGLRRPRLPAHARRQGRAGAAGRRRPARGDSSWLATGRREGDPRDRDGDASARSRGSGSRGARRFGVGGQVPAGWSPATRALAEAHSAGLGGRVKGIRTPATS